MDWARMLAYITGTVDPELLLRNEYLATENRILKAQLKGRLLLTEAERATLGEIGHVEQRTTWAAAFCLGARIFRLEDDTHSATLTVRCGQLRQGTSNFPQSLGTDEVESSRMSIRSHARCLPETARRPAQIPLSRSCMSFLTMRPRAR